jgi:hypothetical protein
MEDDHGPNSNLVYHSTTAEGLEGIIQNRCVWATNVNFLNDTSEYHHGVDIIRGEIERFETGPEKLQAAKIEPTIVALWAAKAFTTGKFSNT